MAKDDNIKVCCTLCAGGNKVLFTFKNTTSNLKKHIAELQHGTVKLTEKALPGGDNQRVPTSAGDPPPPNN